MSNTAPQVEAPEQNVVAQAPQQNYGVQSAVSDAWGPQPADTKIQGGTSLSAGVQMTEAEAQQKRPLTQEQRQMLEQSFWDTYNSSLNQSGIDASTGIILGATDGLCNVIKDAHDIITSRTTADALGLVNDVVWFNIGDEATQDWHAARGKEKMQRLGDDANTAVQTVETAWAPVDQHIGKVAEKYNHDPLNPFLYGELGRDTMQYGADLYSKFCSESPYQQSHDSMQALTEFVFTAGIGNAMGAVAGELKEAQLIEKGAQKLKQSTVAITESNLQPVAVGAGNVDGNILAMTGDSGELQPHMEKPVGKPQVNDADIVNPIDRKAENYKKISQLQQLSAENEPLLQNLTDTIDSKFGTHSTKPDFKEPKEIELKTTRQETKERKPWYEVEHVRDALRTTSIVDNLDVLPGIIREIKAGGEFKIINPDMDKLLNPTQRGWRMVALDLQASNGQIVEYQIVPREMKEAGKIGHAQYKEFRGMDKNLMTDEQALAKAEADRQQVLLYRGAWEAYLRRTGQTEEQIRQIVEQARREL